MVLAGYVSTFTSWIDFSDDWQSALDETPRLSYFKMKEAFRLEEQFGRLRPQERDERVSKFCSIISKHVQFGVVASFKWKTLEVVKGEAPAVVLGLPYLMLLSGMMSTVMTHLFAMQSDPKVLFVFDEQGAAGHQAATTIDNIRGYFTPKEQRAFLGVSHLDDEVILPLQAADSIAWLMRRHAFEHPHCKADLADWEPQYKYLEPLRSIPRLHTHYPVERFRRITEMFEQEKAQRDKS